LPHPGRGERPYVHGRGHELPGSQRGGIVVSGPARGGVDRDDSVDDRDEGWCMTCASRICSATRSWMFTECRSAGSTTSGAFRTARRTGGGGGGCGWGGFSGGAG